MIDISQATKDEYLSDKVHKELTISIPEYGLIFHNEDVIADSLSLTESIETSPMLTFTGCNASTFQVELADIPVDIKGKEITVSIKAGAGEDVPLFKGIVDEQTNSSHEDATMRIVAYDKLYTARNTDVTAWYNSLPWTDAGMSLKAFRDSLFNYLEINQKPIYLVNDIMTVKKTIEPECIYAGEIMRKICEASGVFGKLDRDGEFVYISLKEITTALYPAEGLYPAEDLYPSDAIDSETLTADKYLSVSYDPYAVEKITGIQIREDDTDIGVIIGAPDNPWIIEDNFLMYGKDSTELLQIASNLLEKVRNIKYVPGTVKSLAIPWVECGDAIQLGTKKNYVYTYVLNRTITGTNLIYDTFESLGDKKRNSTVNGIHSQIVQLKGKANRLRRTIDETVSELTNYETKVNREISNHDSRITQNASQISMVVNSYATKKDLENGLTTERNASAAEFKIASDAISQEVTARKEAISGEVVDRNAAIKLSSVAIKMSVAESDSRWDLGGQYIDYKFFADEFPSAWDYPDKKILDIDSGIIYESNGSGWVFVKQCERITDQLHSSIDQTAKRITLSVGKNDHQWDTGGYNVAAKWYTGFELSANEYAGQYGLCLDDGRIYYSNGTSWIPTATATLVTSDLSSRITQTDSSIKSEINARINAVNKLSGDISGLNQTTSDLSSKISQTQSAITTEVTNRTQQFNQLNTATQTAQRTADNARASADAVGNNLTSNYWTSAQTKSQIKQTEDSIKQTVSHSVSKFVLDYPVVWISPNAIPAPSDVMGMYVARNDNFDIFFSNGHDYTHVAKFPKDIYGNRVVCIPVAYFDWNNVPDPGDYSDNDMIVALEAGNGWPAGYIWYRQGTSWIPADGFLQMETERVTGKAELMVDKDNLISKFNLAVNQVVINADNFKLDARGNIKANNADLTGKITALSGKVGGFELADTFMYANNGGSGVGLNANPGIGFGGGTLAMWAGRPNTAWADAPFIVTQEGKLYARNAEISGYSTVGDLNATNIRVRSLEADHVSVESLNAVDAKFDNLSATYASVNDLNAIKGSIGALSASMITSDNLYSQIANIQIVDVIALRVQANALILGGTVYSPKEITVGGQTITVLAKA